MFLPIVLGFLTGVALCLTFGTVFFALIQYSVDNGYKAGLTITAGVVLGDAIYVMFALVGTSVIPHSQALEPILAAVGVIFLVALGLFNIIKGTPRIAYPKTKLGNYAYYFSVCLTSSNRWAASNKFFSPDCGLPNTRKTGVSGKRMWDPLESTCRHASLSIL